MKPLSERFLRWAHKVYGLGEWLQRLESPSCSPRRIPARIKWMALLLGLWCRLGSLYQLERLSKTPSWHQALAIKGLDADTLSRALREADGAQLRRYLASIVQKARRNKVYPQGTLAGWMVASLDGTETYRTRRPTKAVRQSWALRRLDGGTTREYYERAVALSYVGVGPRLVLGIERVRPGETEVAAGLRRIRELDAQLGWAWCDVICADAFYAQARFIEEVRARHKHVVVKVKQKDRALVADMDGLCRGRPPTVQLRDATCELPEERGQRSGQRYQVQIWDVEGLESWEGLSEPVRCLRVWERREERRGGQWLAQEEQVYHIVTTIPSALMKPELVWLIMHRRWDIENSVFNDLKSHWAFDHCYTREPKGIEALYSLYAIAVNLKLLFAWRQLWPRQRRGWTLREVATLLLMCLGELRHGVWSLLGGAAVAQAMAPG